MKKIALKNAARGTAFDYAGQSWILLENDDGRALCLSKDIIETRAFDEGNCNNFAVASSKEYLNGAYLDNLLEDVNGPNAFLTTELDLTTDDGLKDYGTCTVTIFLLTVDQYRRNRDVIPNADDWWWLSTAFSTKSNGYESLARRVLADGTLNWNYACYGDGGLRPACYAFLKGSHGYSGLLWPIFFTGVYYLAFNGILTLLFGRIEKRLQYFS